ncbi:hypothetical protein RND81_11G089000 [Saponaria officinalis]|uniref:Transmembrane protein n=1 Tax=Saponaria officinalis TaxID=3572 RepID=A0AAW1HIR2_SAPOF
MIRSTNLISCNFQPITPHYLHHKTHKTHTLLSSFHSPKLSNSLKHHHKHTILALYHKNKNKGSLQICLKSSVSDDPIVDDEEDEDEDDKNPAFKTDENDGNGSGGDWNTSVLLFVFWVAIMYYVFNLAPNQTPTTDVYFVKKLSNLVGDDGFRMNQVLVSLWYIMGLWPIIYSMLLLPSARSSKTSIPVWPFATLSFFGGAYALIPYFILWRPPPPLIKEEEVRRWPLNFLESKITAGVRIYYCPPIDSVLLFSPLPFPPFPSPLFPSSFRIQTKY